MSKANPGMSASTSAGPRRCRRDFRRDEILRRRIDRRVVATGGRQIDRQRIGLHDTDVERAGGVLDAAKTELEEPTRQRRADLDHDIWSSRPQRAQNLTYTRRMPEPVA